MTTTGALLVAAALATAAVAQGCADATDGATDGSAVEVADPAVGAVPGETAAVYMTIDNSGGEDALVGASCTCATGVSLHTVEDHGGILTMVATDRIPLGADSQTVLDPGRAHVMLEGLHDPLEVGSLVELALEFDRAPNLAVEVPVVALAELAERVEQGA